MNSPINIAYVAMGGTIASKNQSGTKGASPSLNAENLLEPIKDFLPKNIKVLPKQFSMTPSAHLSLIQIIQMVNYCKELDSDPDANISGFVISQGTDTLEETSFLTDLMWESDTPIIFTAAMRNPSLPGADGASNLLSSILLAADENSNQIGVLVCLNDEIHTARYVQKTHSTNPSTFKSPGLGPIGWIRENIVQIVFTPSKRSYCGSIDESILPKVGLVRFGLDDPGDILPFYKDLNYKGLVIEASGGGHISPSMFNEVKHLIDNGLTIVFTTRCSSGEALESSYNYEASEIEMIKYGAMRSGHIVGIKARLLLTLALANDWSKDQISFVFANI